MLIGNEELLKSTIKANKKDIQRLHGIRGHMDYLNPPKKHTIGDVIHMLVENYYNSYFTDAEKEKMVEDAVSEFSINQKFVDMLHWLIDELDIIYKEKQEKYVKQLLETMDNPPKMPPKTKRKVKINLSDKK